MTELFTPEFYADPYPVYARMRAQAPVQRTGTREGRTTWLVTGYPEAREALAAGLSNDTHRFFAEGGSGRNLASTVSGTMLATDPPDHTRLRRLVTRAFTTSTVNRLTDRIQQITDQLVDELARRGGGDLVSDLASPLPVTVISELLGVPETDRADLHHWSGELFRADHAQRVDHASHRVADYMSQLVDTKRAHPGTDLMSELIAVRDTDRDRLAERELVSLAVLLLIAGHETTTNLVGNGVLALLTHPQQFTQLTNDPALVPTAVEEMLRYDSPLANATFRWATTPTTIGGVEIPAGEVVTVSIGAANRDPRQFPDPDAFDVTRDPRRHLAFGHGIHACLGAPLARAEARIALSTLVTRFPGLGLAASPDELTWRHSVLLRGLHTLPVTVAPSG